MSTERLADLFAEARTLLEGKTIGCARHPGAPQQECTACRGSDPSIAYDALRGLVFFGITHWEEAPDGALEGALKKALPLAQPEPGDAVIRLALVLTRLLMTPGDTRIPAMQAVVEWLRGEA